MYFYIEVEERLEEDESKSADEDAESSSPSDGLGISFSSIKARFQNIRRSGRDKQKSGLSRPAVLKEVSLMPALFCFSLQTWLVAY